MDNYHLREFSPDQKLLAIIQKDGKLKIWDVEKNQLKQEYVPNLHLSTPCTALKWIRLSTGQKKKSKSSEVGGTLHIILGTSKGGLALFSLATAKIETTFKGDGHSGAVSSIDHDSTNFIFTSGLDAKVIKWSIKNCQHETAFDCGPEKPTAICLIKNGDQIATASKSIKIWGSDSQLLHTFTGHSSNVLILKSFEFGDDSFIVSASKNDRNLSLWKVMEENKKPGAAATFTLLNNSPSCADFRVTDDYLQLACVCRNESIAFFETNMSSLKSKKPIKAKFTLEIAGDGAGKVDHIPLGAVTIIGEDLLIGYGDMLMTFELVPNKQPQKNMILVRADPMKMKVKKKKNDSEPSMSLVTPIVDKDVEILNVVSSRRKAHKPVEVPLETRLDNLTVGTSKKPNAKKMTHQLMQGLHGKDANILRNVLRQTDEETVRLTVQYLPPQYVMAFVNELSLLMTKKTAGSEIALMWLRFLIQTHASSLMAYGIDNLNATFGTTLGIIDHRTQNLPGLSRLRGRLDLLVKQLKQNSDIDDEVRNENTLVYEDSDDDSDMDAKSGSSDEDIFDEFDDEDADSGNPDDENMNGNDSGSDEGNDDDAMDYSD